MQRDLALRRRPGRVFHESGRTAERLLRLQHTDQVNSPLTEATDTGITEIEQRLRSLGVTNTMTPQVEVYGPRAPQNPPQVGYPSISYNAPDLKRFSGKAGEYQTITDSIEAIERQALLECRGDEAAKVKLSMSLFCMNLKGDARAYLGMLTSTEKESWEKLKEVYIYKFKTERDLKAKQSRDPQDHEKYTPVYKKRKATRKKSAAKLLPPNPLYHS